MAAPSRCRLAILRNSSADGSSVSARWGFATSWKRANWAVASAQGCPWALWRGVPPGLLLLETEVQLEGSLVSAS